MEMNPYQSPTNEPAAARGRVVRKAVAKLGAELLRAICPLLIGLGVLGIPFGAFYGAEGGHDGPPAPIEIASRRKAEGKAIMFVSGAVGVAAALALYLADRKRNRPR